ncbi:response regulator transcription factor [Phototrophicus methaneseepsis]|uniref:Response regulator transcription factor n=1 Tax=Phototrophicus methaneseepsis TaxID=2710758 RepID=A0A7S8E583_9CHLR|nr:response regulator transcription factor [Phototrophicus methaneseepsis]QPC80591.1 response regulator transcription factor [Phototrophicus methaneseepsis]
MIHVFIVDDHPLFREGLMGALSYEDDIEVVGICADGLTALKKIKELSPDVVLLDINLPDVNGLQIARKLNASDNDTSVVILTAHHDEEQTLHAMRSGASAYCAKDVDADTLVSIIRSVAEGYYVVGDKQMSHNEYLNWLNTQLEDNIGYTTDAEAHYIPLSPREMEILQYVTSGLINKEIASKLGISQQTVKNHMTSILKKLNVNDRTQAAIMALRRGWVRVNDNQQEA